MFCHAQGHDDVGFRIMIQDIDVNLRILVLKFSNLPIFEWKGKAGIINLVQKGLVVIDFIRFTTSVDWMDMSEDTVQEAKIAILILHVQDGFPTFDELRGEDIRGTGDW